MKDRLYYQDAYIQTFDSTVIQQSQDEQGRPFVVLENSAFYPGGGGQPSDRGTLNGVPVTEVEVAEDGQIRHYLEASYSDSTTDIHGELDWRRRFDHMQQHAGQHILSAAFASLYDYQTVSFHLGQEHVTIDLETPSVSSEALQYAQERANQIVFENHPILTKWIEQEALSNYPIRKAPKVTENIRLVMIEEIDYNACGGTHPNRTGEVGPIKILGTEKIKDKTRVIFVCGYRTIQALDAKHAIIQSLSQTLMRPQEDLTTMVDQLLSEQKRLTDELDELKKQMIGHEAEVCIKKAQLLSDDKKLIAQFFIDRPIGELQQLAFAIKDRDPNAYILLTVTNEDKLQFIAARGQKLDLNMNGLIKEVLPLINGRGGGKPDHVQGGGTLSMTASALLEHLKQALVGKGTMV